MVTLRTDFLGFGLDNPFILASAPPTKDYESIKKAFEAGWAGAVTKSIGVTPFTDVMPRIAHIKEGGRVIATQNFEMGTIYSLEDWIGIVNRLKDEFPGKLVYASIIAAANEDDWRSMAGKLAGSKVDGIELNLSCPHLTHKGEGAVVGENGELAGRIVRWVKSEVGSEKKIMPKLTYAAGLKIGSVAKSCVENGADAIAAINTILGLCEIDKQTLKPKLHLNGKTAYCGMSAGAMRPLGRYAVAEIAKAVDPEKFPISATGGISDLDSTVEYLALGANNLQVCSAVMNRGYRRGYGMVFRLKEELLAYMEAHRFESIADFRGKALPRVVPYTELDGRKRVARKVEGVKCTGCGMCEDACMYDAITASKETKSVVIDSEKCDGCGSCVSMCKFNHLEMVLVEAPVDTHA
ncbi:MAG: 4Fe-4S dicluster domain-containing protein [Elusimicrobiota bacterium]